MPAQDLPSPSRRRWFLTVLLVLVVLAVAAGIALSRLRHADAGTGSGAAPTASTVLGGAPAASTGLGAPAASTEPVAGTGTEPGTGGHTTPTRRAPSSTAPSPAKPSGPVIAYFRVTAKPSCPSGTDKFRTEGQPVTLEWKATGADKTTLSVDGPGIYQEYASSDSATVNFPCSGDPGTYQTHTYLVRAIGPDGTTSRKLVVQAKVNDITTT